MERNRDDSLHNDLVRLMKSSNVSVLFETDDKRQKTVASKFRRRLKKLLEDVSRTETRYVRCVKPNGEASSSLFDASSVCAQLRCAGVVAAVEMTRAATPTDLGHAAFLARYGRLTSESRCRRASHVHYLVKGGTPSARLACIWDRACSSSSRGCCLRRMRGVPLQ